jgi:hypothetical protein
MQEPGVSKLVSVNLAKLGSKTSGPGQQSVAV